MSRKTRRNVPAPKQQHPAPPKSAQVTQQIAIQQAWQGPLPSPEVLARFDQVLPGTAERIICMAEQEGAHAREVEMRLARGSVRLQHIGQIMAFLLAAGAMFTSYRLAVTGHEWVAGILVGGTLVALVSAFLNARKGKSGK